MKAAQLTVGAEYAFAHRPGADVDVSYPHLTRVRYVGVVEGPGRYSFDKPVQYHAFEALADDGEPQGRRVREKTARCILGTWDEHVEALKARRASEAAAAARRQSRLEEYKAEAEAEAARWRAFGVSVFVGPEYERTLRPADFPVEGEYEAALEVWQAVEQERKAAVIHLVPEVGGVKLVGFRYTDLVGLREKLTDREWA